MSRAQLRAILWVIGAVIYGLIPQQTREVLLMVAGAAFIGLLFVSWLCSLEKGGAHHGKKATEVHAELPHHEAE